MNSPAALIIGIGKPGGRGNMMPKGGSDEAEYKSQVGVSLDALKANDGNGDVPPEVGDKVEFSATGTVTSTDGGRAWVDVDTVNGQPVAKGKEKETEEPKGEEAEEKGLRNAAMEDDQMMGG